MQIMGKSGNISPMRVQWDLFFKMIFQCLNHQIRTHTNKWKKKQVNHINEKDNDRDKEIKKEWQTKREREREKGHEHFFGKIGHSFDDLFSYFFLQKIC